MWTERPIEDSRQADPGPAELDRDIPDRHRHVAIVKPIAAAPGGGRKLAIGIVTGDRECLHRPVSGRSLAPGGALVVEQVPAEIGGDRLGVDAQLSDERRVPEMVQVPRPEAWRRDALGVAAEIKAVGGVQRLVQITDEMKEELQCQHRRCWVHCQWARLGVRPSADPDDRWHRHDQRPV
jgi:hypothetical protein